jgi:hypothetical protein
MGTLLLIGMLAVGADQGTGASAAVQGKWLIVYAEEGGRRNNSWEQRQATITDSTLKYEADGKEHTIHVKFEPHQTLEASAGTSGQNHRGVYVLGKDYLVVSLESGRFSGTARGAGREKGTAAGAGGGEHSSGSFILILRRQGTGGANR